LKLEFNLSKIIDFPNPFKGAKFTKLKGDLLGMMIQWKENDFENQTDPDGNPWTPLSKKTIAKRLEKGKGAKILEDTFSLKNSLKAKDNGVNSTSGNEVILGTNVEYAKIQNFGGTIMMPENKNAFGLKIVSPAHPIIIPARPFMGIGKKDEEEITEAIEFFLSKAVK
jgi:phage virion morphogenesis protein